MTEEEWNACSKPDRMLAFLGGKTSERKLRLFACACCRRVWRSLTPRHGRRAVEVAELFADGETSDQMLRDAHRVLRNRDTPAHAASAPDLSWAVYDAASEAVRYKAASSTGCWTGGFSTDRMKEEVVQAAMLRCIFANPFHAVAIDPAWQTATVRALAEAAYDSRTLIAGTLDHFRLAVLADAVEEAGCDNADILNHLREPRQHVRGCWPVDLLLGKG